jgi:hypothetical protein
MTSRARNPLTNRRSMNPVTTASNDQKHTIDLPPDVYTLTSNQMQSWNDRVIHEALRKNTGPK